MIIYHNRSYLGGANIFTIAFFVCLVVFAFLSLFCRIILDLLDQSMLPNYILFRKFKKKTAGLLFEDGWFPLGTGKASPTVPPDCLAVFCVFTVTDLAHRRALEGQICADVLRCHIASDARIRETSEQPARLSGQMASHHLPSHSEEADVKGKRASRGWGGGGGGGGWRRLAWPHGPGRSLHLLHLLHLCCLRSCNISLIKMPLHVSHCAKSVCLTAESCCVVALKQHSSSAHQPSVTSQRALDQPGAGSWNYMVSRAKYCCCLELCRVMWIISAITSYCWSTRRKSKTSTAFLDLPYGSRATHRPGFSAKSEKRTPAINN